MDRWLQLLRLAYGVAGSVILYGGFMYRRMGGDYICRWFDDDDWRIGSFVCVNELLMD